MKKIILLNTITLIAVLLFSACGSNSSLTKRHYSNGYYFSHSKGKHALAKTAVKKSPLQSTDIVVKPINKSETNITQGNPISESLIVSNENNYKKPSAEKNVSKSFIHLPTIHDDAPVVKVKKAIFKKQSAAASDSAGLSLLWIVIVVLLILWALGLLAGGFGLGGFINILLVIALILLILWLLRII